MDQDDALKTHMERMKTSVNDPQQATLRLTTSRRLASALQAIGKHAFVSGHILGTDRRDGRSPFGHGSDAVVAVSRLASIASELLSASADLIADGRVYAGSALLRQLVEVEYLARAFAKDSDEASKWLRRDKQQRMKFFSPRKLRESSDGFFRDGDYTWHCEMGGHPVPDSGALLENRNNLGQLLLSDAIGHAGRIAGFTLGFLKDREALLEMDHVERAVEDALTDWRNGDDLTNLPPHPLPGGSVERTLH